MMPPWQADWAVAMRAFVALVLVAVGVLHLLPLVGVLGGSQLERLYGVAIADPALLVLLRHRAVLFGLVGAACLYAAFRPLQRMPVIVAGLASTLSFVALAGAEGPNAAMHRIVLFDVGAALLLGLAALVHLRQQRGRHRRRF